MGRWAAKVVDMGRGGLFLLWLTATAVATTVGLLAVSIVGDQIRAGTFRELVAAGDRAEAERDPQRILREEYVELSTLGGTVTVGCASTGPAVTAVSPAPGWSLVSRVQAEGSVTLELVGDLTAHEATIHCDGTTPSVTSQVRPAPGP